MKNLSILGSTGSIGQNCLRVVGENTSLFKVIGLAAGNNIDELFKQIKVFRPQTVSVSNSTSKDLLKKKLMDLPLSDRPRLLSGI